MGHIAVALAGKGARPGIPIWFLVFVSQLPDWLVVVASLSGYGIVRLEGFTETSLNFVLIALPVALLYYAFTRDGRSSAVVWLVAASHPVCDFFTGTHTALPGGKALGLNWYHRPTHDFAIETILVVVGAMIYRKSLPEQARRSALFVILISSLVLIQATVDVYLASSRRGGWLSEQVGRGRLLP